MRHTPEFGETISNEFVEGLGLIDEKMVLILNIDQLVDWQKVPDGNPVEISESNAEGIALEAGMA